MTKSIDLLSAFAESNGHALTGGTENLGYEFRRLSEGQRAGVDQVTLNCGGKQIDILPTRGMGIWQAKNQGVRFGWNSPIAGPVHPMWVPISESSGIGWLDGFDEMMVRCGLESNGAPDFDGGGHLKFPLHGRIANLPASNVDIDIDESAGRIAIRGTVHENRFHFQRLQLQTEIALQLDSDEISITDCVTNLSNRPASCQMLYHTNFGPPILESGSQIFAPVKKLVPRDAPAAADLDDWNRFGPPNPNPACTEQVYFMELAADSGHDSLVVLTNSDQSKAVSIRYDVINMPCFSIWKNTVGEADGYVCGLEPATNFPNPKSFEESQGRVIRLAAGKSRTLSLKIGMLIGSDRVQSARNKVEALAVSKPQVSNQPTPDWCSP